MADFERSNPGALVARRRRLPGLRPPLRRLRRRRHRRPAGHHLAAAVPARPRRRRALDHAVLPVARSTTGVRRGRLRRRRPAVRHASPTPTRCSRRRTTSASRSSSTWCPTTPPTSTSGSRRRWPPRPGSPERERYLFRAGQGPRTASSRRTTGSSVFGGIAWTRVDGRRVVPPPLRPHPARPELAQPRGARRCSRTCCGSGSTAASTASGSTSPTACSRTQSLRDEKVVEQPTAQLAARRRRCSSATPRTSRCGTSPRSTTSTGAGARSSTSTTATGWPSPRPGPRRPESTARYVRPDELQPGLQLRLAAGARGRRRHRRRASAARSPPLDPVGATPTWVLSQPRRRPARDAVRRRPGRRGPRPRRDAGDAGAARARRTSTRARSSASRGRRRPRSSDRTRPGSAPASSGATAAGCRSRGAGTRRRSASAGRKQPWLPMPAEWADLTVEAQTGKRGSTLAFYRKALTVRRTFATTAPREVEILDRAKPCWPSAAVRSRSC